MDLPDQTDRIAIVTGSNTGIGEITARELARAGAKVYVACRSESKATDAIARIRGDVPDANLEFVALDLASLDSVRAAAATIQEREDRLDILVNNAGLAGPKGLTSDGFELAFGVNHLGHFLFTLLLRETLEAAEAARIVNVASDSHYRAKGIDWDTVTKTSSSPTGMPEYEASKLANVLFTIELNKRIAETALTTYSLHPGVVATDIWSRSWGGKIVGLFAPFFMISPEDGAKTQLHCATAADATQSSGLYWNKCKVRRHNKAATDELAAELWKRSLEWTDAPDWPA